MLRWLVIGLLWGLLSSEVHATIASASLTRSGQCLMQKGQWYSFRLGALPGDDLGTIRSLSWQITSDVAWPQPPVIFLCLNNICQRLDAVAGRSTGFAGILNRGEWQIKLQLPGYGAQQPPILVRSITLTVNSHRDSG